MLLALLWGRSIDPSRLELRDGGYVSTDLEFVAIVTEAIGFSARCGLRVEERCDPLLFGGKEGGKVGSVGKSGFSVLQAVFDVLLIGNHEKTVLAERAVEMSLEKVVVELFGRRILGRIASTAATDAIESISLLEPQATLLLSKFRFNVTNVEFFSSFDRVEGVEFEFVAVNLRESVGEAGVIHERRRGMQRATNDLTTVSKESKFVAVDTREYLSEFVGIVRLIGEGQNLTSLRGDAQVFLGHFSLEDQIVDILVIGDRVR